METNVIDKEEPIALVKEQANLGGIRISAAVSMHRDLARSDQLIDYLSTSPRVRLHRGAEGMSNTNTVEASGDRRCRETRDAASHSCEEGRGRERCCSEVITVLRASGIVNGGRVGEIMQSGLVTRMSPGLNLRAFASLISCHVINQ